MSLLMNRGAQLLAQADSITGAAEKLGVNARTVSAWRSGTKVPNEESRAKIARIYGIHRREWDRRVEEPEAPPPRPPRGAATPARSPDPPWLDALVDVLEFAHPLALLAVYRVAAVTTNPHELADLDAALGELRQRHPDLVAACEAAERALGAALAADLPGDPYAAAFLKEAA